MYDDQEYDRPSKSQLKRDAKALQALGEELAGLGPAAVDRADLPRAVKDALNELRTLKTHEARRRHIQYIGKLMRDVDPAQARAVVDEARSSHQDDTDAFHRVEEWRDRLADGDEELLAELFDRHPDMDGQRFRQLVMAARRERKEGGKPKQCRQLFRFLAALEPSEP